MPEFLPFAGIHYDLSARAGDVGAVVAPPYDVIDEDQRAALEATDPHNSVRLILPRDARGRDRYQAAADTMASWLDDGILVPDDRPRFYGYRMDFEDEDGRPRHTQGVLGALTLPEPGGSATVLPHERTMPKAKSDRLALLRATRANLDPIWCLSLADGLTNVVGEGGVGEGGVGEGGLGEAGAALAACVDDEGVRHRLHALDEPALVARIEELVGGAALVIADGHHRFETACTYRDERTAAGLDDAGARRIMALVVELTDDELRVRAIHRVLSGIAGADLRASLANTFDVTAAGANTTEGVETLERRMHDTDALGLVDRTGLALIRPRPDALRVSLEGVDEPVRDVDATVFEAAVRPALPEAVEIGYRNGAAAVAALVDKGVADAAVLLRPVTVRQIREAAFAGVRMPEKTTFFHPKPRTGMVFRSLDR